MRYRSARLAGLAGLALLAVACGADEGGTGERPGRDSGSRRPGSPGERFGGGGDEAEAAVPVEVATARRQAIAAYIETNGTLEAENEVDVVARTAAPIVELLVEEGLRVREGQLLARLEQDEIAAQLEVVRVELEEARLAYERARTLRDDALISDEEHDRARAAFESAQARHEGARVQFQFTEIRAPFGGLIVARYVDPAQQVGVNQALFRLSDFTPLLCPIQVPERELGKLRLGQRAGVRVDAFPDLRFEARVLRISPVVDAATGTVKVTLEVDARDRLRPGMFARVFLETERRNDALVIPRAALSLESIGDVVYVTDGGVAARREVELGFEESGVVEVRSGVAEGEAVVVVGQDGLSEGTPVQVLRRDEAPAETPAAVAADSRADASDPGAAAPRGEDRGEGRGPRGRGGRPDFAAMTPEQLERAKQFMRERGMSEEQIEERIRRARSGAGRGGE